MTTTFNVRDYGAVGDGSTNDASPIQLAIDACATHGGGTVLIPSGATYLEGRPRGQGSQPDRREG